MARKTRNINAPLHQPQARATTKTPARLSLLRMFIRGLAALSIIAMIFMLSQPGVVDGLWNLFQGRIESHSSGGFDTHGGITRGDAELAPVFTSEIMYWREDILRWGLEKNLNPNLIATVMQIESCGHPYISSHAGAQGLFQVMPLHFGPGENHLNPETNAQAGLNHLQDCLNWTNYDIAVTLACYNGGPSVIGLSPDQWYAESQYYSRWGTAIYNEAAQGLDFSPTVNEWLGAGGTNLCRESQRVQNLVMPYIVSQSVAD